MFGDYSLGDLGSIFVMQGFAGLILFSVFVLMALGLAIIFGQMGVINMAHGEFMILGAYVTWMTSNFFQQHLPSLFTAYFFVAMILAFLASGALGMLHRVGLDPPSLQAPARHAARHLGPEPDPAADLSLGVRRARGRRRTAGVDDGLAADHRYDRNPDQRHVRDGADHADHRGASLYVMFWSSWGKQVRAVVQNRVMAGAVGINTDKVDRLTFGLGCGIAGIAGSAFTMIGSTGPTAGQLYIVDTFLVVVFGGAASLLGTIASAFTISQAQSTLEFFMSGSMAKVIDAARHRRNPDAAAAGAVRPQGAQVIGQRNRLAILRGLHHMLDNPKSSTGPSSLASSRSRCFSSSSCR